MAKVPRIILISLIGLITGSHAEVSRIDSELDESSCICGLNRDLLEQLESILRIVEGGKDCGKNVTTQEVSSSLPLEETKLEEFGTEQENHQSEVSPGPQVESEPDDEPMNVGSNKHEPPQTSLSATVGESSSNHQAERPPEAPKPAQISPGQTDHQDHDAQMASLIAQIQSLQSQISSMSIESDGQQSNRGNISESAPEPSKVQKPEEQEEKESPAPAPSLNARPSNPVGQSFIQGLAKPTVAGGSGLGKLNQTTDVETADVTSALETTVPSVVSNIFGNIKNLTSGNLSLKPAKNENPTVLTSIDGSSVNVSHSSVSEITAEGEKLFLSWIEHQLESMHLTVAAANYIRKNALILFRRIVKEYISRVQQMGGSIEDNIRRATQIALSNTQTLTSFILRNYVNFAGGLLRIIGEQVSHVGKQLDATGNSIATMSLNPFDIVSDVVQSLPNPSDYAEYFREFGKHLLGESPSSSQQQSDASAAEKSEQTKQAKPSNLLSKTMGALGKTFGSWIG